MTWSEFNDTAFLIENNGIREFYVGTKKGLPTYAKSAIIIQEFTLEEWQELIKYKRYQHYLKSQ